jgi:hypothetical protein
MFGLENIRLDVLECVLNVRGEHENVPVLLILRVENAGGTTDMM